MHKFLCVCANVRANSYMYDWLCICAILLLHENTLYSMCVRVHSNLYSVRTLHFFRLHQSKILKIWETIFKLPMDLKRGRAHLPSHHWAFVRNEIRNTLFHLISIYLNFHGLMLNCRNIIKYENVPLTIWNPKKNFFLKDSHCNQDSSSIVKIVPF